MQTAAPGSIDPNQRRWAAAVAGCLSQCMTSLDALDEGLAAAHVSLALEMLKRDYGLEGAD